MSKNPFIGPEGHGPVSAADRIDMVERLDLDELYDALEVAGLQKSVMKKIMARIRRLERAGERPEGQGRPVKPHRSGGGAPRPTVDRPYLDSVHPPDRSGGGDNE